MLYSHGFRFGFCVTMFTWTTWRTQQENLVELSLCSQPHLVIIAKGLQLVSPLCFIILNIFNACQSIKFMLRCQWIVIITKSHTVFAIGYWAQYLWYTFEFMAGNATNEATGFHILLSKQLQKKNKSNSHPASSFYIQYEVTVLNTLRKWYYMYHYTTTNRVE